MDLENIHSLKRPALQKLAKKYGLKAGGKNVDIIARLVEYREILIGHQSPTDLSETPTSQVPVEPQDCPNAESLANAIIEVNDSNVTQPSISSSPFLSPVTPRRSVLTSESKDGMAKRFSELQAQRASLTPTTRQRVSSIKAQTPAQQQVLREVNERAEAIKQSRKRKISSQVARRSTDLRRQALKKKSTGIPHPTLKSATKRFDAIHEKQFKKMQSVDEKPKAKPKAKIPRVAMLATRDKPAKQNRDPNPQPRRKFDLKASLNRTVSWEMKQGKIPRIASPEKKRPGLKMATKAGPNGLNRSVAGRSNAQVAQLRGM